MWLLNGDYGPITEKKMRERDERDEQNLVFHLETWTDIMYVEIIMDTIKI